MSDLIVVGSGAAGLATTLAAVERGARVTLLTAGPLLSGSSPWAQGGVAAVFAADDSPELHAADTLAVGAGLNDAEAVGVLTRGGVRVARELIAAGVPFDGGPTGPDLALEAGHHRRRILHAGGGATGRAVTETLLARIIEHPLVRVRPHSPAEELLAEGGRIVGVRSGAGSYEGRAVVLATGGYAALWGRTTNTADSRGGGLALAYRAGATLADLEFVQFHPTALVLPGQAAFLLTEALRGEGAQLVDAAERPVVDPLLARDIVARAVARHRRDVGPVYLSLRGLDPTFVHERFPNISERLCEWGLDLARDLLPVAPAAHYCMGGIRTDSAGRTDLPGLYVAGEAACTGVQGANRLASNSLLECLVFGRQAANAALTDAPDACATWAGSVPPAPRVWEEQRTAGARASGNGAAPTTASSPDFRLPTPDFSPQYWGAEEALLGERLDHDLGVERDAKRLTGLLDDLAAPVAPALADATLVAKLATQAALLRRESRGAHYRTDAPDTEPRWRGHILWRRDMAPSFEEVAQ
ncbi:MAG TPA: FAD-dependent oxidoreductase [Thermomicrobiales bacterium]|jgi:L-aspartate oxidase